MAKKIYSMHDLAEILAHHVPPAGWKVEVAFRPATDDPDAVEVAVSSPMTSMSWVDWGDGWPLVKEFRFEPQNIPHYPEHYGDTEKEALENLCDEVAEEWWPEVSALFPREA